MARKSAQKSTERIGITVFEEHLRTQGLRLTRERRIIVEDVMVREGHFDLEELHMDLVGRGHRVSRASVYRTVPILVEAGILEQVQNTDKHAHYERTLGRSHHDHMLCSSCGGVVEFYSDELEDLQERLCRQYGFKGETHTLEIRGLCAPCQRKK